MKINANINIILRNIGKIILNILLIIYSFSCIFPIIWMAYSSLKTSAEFNRDIISLPTKLNFENYVEAFKTGKMAVYSLNSAFNAVIALVFTLLIAYVIGYFIARFEFKGRKLIYILFMFGMFVPIYALLVPVFIQFKTFGLFDKRITLIIPYVAFGLPIGVFLCESFIRGIPKEMEEAAVIDGAGLSRILFSIVLPMTKPILVTIGILQFCSNWNEFPLALVLVNSESYKTVPIGLQNFSGQYATDYPTMMAGLMLATLPIIVIYLIFNKNIIEGMTSGAVKG